MITVKAYGEEVIKSGCCTNVRSIQKSVSITRLRNRATSKGQFAYYGFCPDYNKEFPSVKDSGWDEFQTNHGWVHIYKKDNPRGLLPVLKMGEEI